MTTLDDRPTPAPTREAPEPTPESDPTASASATAIAVQDEAPNMQPRRAGARVARARARIADRPRSSKDRTRSPWQIAPLLDSRPRTLREQQDYIRQQQVGRPSPTAADTSKWRVIGEHAHDAGLWALFVVKCLAMTVEWCCESYTRFAVLAAVVAALIVLF
jgi:hypothetical protein